MSNYNIKLTPNFIDPTTEGSLDSSILNGKSLQRTFNMYEVDNAGSIIQKLFKQVIAQQEIDLEGKTAQEKADLIRVMLENLADDHPLVVNMRNRQS